MDGARDNLLAGATFTGNQHRGNALGNGTDGLADLENRGAFTNDLVEVDAIIIRFSDGGNLAGQTVAAQCIAQGRIEFDFIHGFANEVVGAELHGPNGQRVVADAGDHDHGG